MSALSIGLPGGKFEFDAVEIRPLIKHALGELRATRVSTKAHQPRALPVSTCRFSVTNPSAAPTKAESCLNADNLSHFKPMAPKPLHYRRFFCPRFTRVALPRSFTISARANAPLQVVNHFTIRRSKAARRQIKIGEGWG